MVYRLGTVCIRLNPPHSCDRHQSVGMVLFVVPLRTTESDTETNDALVMLKLSRVSNQLDRRRSRKLYEGVILGNA